jgi:long-chain fatty acid transport protein
VTLLSLLVPAATAAGFYTADAGILPISQGGTGVTGFASPFAVYYNPAGLSRIDRPTFSLGASANIQYIEFERVDPDGTRQPVASNAGKPLAIPEFGFATPLVKDKLVLALGFTSPTAPDYTFPADGAQRYSMIGSVVWSFQFGPALSWQPDKRIAIGVGLQAQVLRIEQHLAITTNGRTDGSGDVGVVASVWDRFTPGLNAGVVVEPIEDQLRFGLSIQPGLTYLGRGDGSLDFTGNGLDGILDQTVWTDDSIRLGLKMPTVLRAGVTVNPAPPLAISGEFVFENWSSLSEILISDIDVTVTGGKDRKRHV